MKFFCEKGREFFPYLIGAGIFTPMFFTLSGGLYKSSTVMTDSNGLIMSLPLPISILVCSIAILCFLNRLRDAQTSLRVIFWMVSAIVISLCIANESATSSYRKLIVSFQVILPFSGLLVGQLLGDKSNSVAKSFLMILTIVVPFQLFGSIQNSPWLNEGGFLTNQVGFFTVYGHIQFVTLIFVSAFAYSASILFDEYKLWLLGMCVLMFFYVLKSWSYLTMGAYSCVVFALLFSRGYLIKKNLKYGFIAIIALITISILMAHSFEHEEEKRGLLWNISGATYTKMKPFFEGQIPPNLQERIGDWKRFGGGILENPKAFFFGHAQPMPREIRSSAHNWYIDVAYTFGVIGVLPVMGLLFYSVRLFWLLRHSIPVQTWWLMGIVIYLVVIDSNFKVTLRQPYPGIFTFFMWGILLERLHKNQRMHVTA